MKTLDQDNAKNRCEDGAIYSYRKNDQQLVIHSSAAEEMVTN